MIKVGQIGKGNFGKKILSKLNSIKEVSVEWVCGSQNKWWEQNEVDWVIIATPNEFHYEQAKYFLKNNTNVFCEKPGTLCSKSLQELIQLSKNNGLYFYIDDVLIYENINPIQSSFIYKKWGGSSANIIDRMAYHHFYLIFDYYINKIIPEIKILKNKKNHKIFELKFSDLVYKFEYNFNWYKQKIHTIKLSTIGYKIDLFESKNDIMSAASGINQYRVHRGYHYPRSFDTIISCKNNEASFIKNYNRSIINDMDHFYAISSNDSLTTAEEYLSVLDNAKLEWQIADNLPECDVTVKVKEKLYDHNILKKICKERIHGNGINLILNKKITRELKEYKYKVYATYSALNDLNDEKQNYQFELCEKPVFKLPSRYKNKSIVVMDGPFMCFDPLANTDHHVAGNVVHAIHVRNTGKKPEVPPSYKKYLNKGIIKNPKYTNVERFIESAKKFFPEIEQAKHLGSMYTIRTVLPNKDTTDERPTIVKKQDNNFILFSGKVGNCVEASNEIVSIIKK
jgi:hypothetical protein